MRALTADGRLGGAVLVALDGWDDGPAAAAAVDEIAGLWGAHRGPGLRLLLAGRGGTPAWPGPVLDLVEDCPRGADDVGEYLAATTSLSRRLRAGICAAAQGCYLYAELAAGLAGEIGGRAPALPGDGLTGLYRLVLDRRLAGDQFGWQVLALIARGRGPGLTGRQIAAMTGASAAAVAAIVDRCGSLVSRGRYLRPHHRCLSEYLFGCGRHDAAELDWTIAAGMLDRWAGRWKTCHEPYVLRNVLVHLADAYAGGGARAAAARDAMSATVADPAFLTSAVARVGAEDVRSAIRYAGVIAPQRLAQLDEVSAALAAQSGPLRLARAASDTAMVAQQLAFEAASAGGGELGRAVATQAGGGILTLWATAHSPYQLAPTGVRGHRAAVRSAVIASTGNLGVTMTNDGAVKVWRLASGKLAHDLATDATVTGLLPMPGGHGVAAAHADGGAELWDVGSGSLLAQILAGRTVTVTAFAVSADSTTAVTADVEGTITIWDLTLGEVVRRLPNQTSFVSAVAISADGFTAATSGPRNWVTVWCTASGKPIRSVDVGAPVTALALTPEGRGIVIGSDLWIRAQCLSTPAAVTGCLRTRSRVTAIAVNPAMPRYVLFGTHLGQVAYAQLPH
jgi:hypothetical protein